MVAFGERAFGSAPLRSIAEAAWASYGSQSRAASALGIPRSTFFDLVHGLRSETSVASVQRITSAFSELDLPRRTELEVVANLMAEEREDVTLEAITAAVSDRALYRGILDEALSAWFGAEGDIPADMLPYEARS